VDLAQRVVCVLVVVQLLVELDHLAVLEKIVGGLVVEARVRVPADGEVLDGTLR